MAEGRALLGILVIPLTGSTDEASLMDEEAGHGLCLQRLFVSIIGELLLPLEVLGLEVARLDHEVLDDPMELHPVEGMLTHELQIAISMDGGLIEELDDEVPLRRLDEDLRAVGALSLSKGS